MSLASDHRKIKMIYLLEHEIGFDPNCIGFPSIQGCHAVVYQTSAGLYGFHIAGGSANGDWAANANVFRQFIDGHGGLNHPGTRLYGVTFVGNNQRGYSLSVRDNWKGELQQIASALGYTGKISGYDLFKTLGNNTSAYVEFQARGPKCKLYIRRWAHDQTTKVPNTNPDNHKIRIRPPGQVPTLGPLASVITSLDRGQLTHVHKEQLR